MKQKIVKILKKYDNPLSWWRGISPSKYEDVADEIMELIEKEAAWEYGVDWAGLDPVKWKDVKPSRKYIVFGDTEDITITP